MDSETRERKIRLSEMKLRHLIDTFLATFDNADTKGTYRRSLRQFVLWRARNPEFRFLVKDVERYKRHLTKRKKLSEVSVSTYLTALRRFCSFLVQQKILFSNPAKRVDGNRRPRSHTRSMLSNRDVQRLLDSLSGEHEVGLRDSAIMKLMLECGLSEAELVKIDVEDVTLSDGELSVAVQGKGKTTKDDRAMLSANVAAVVRRYLDCRRIVDPKSPLFLSACNRTRGERMSTSGIREVITRYLTAAGLKNGGSGKISPHSLRHTAARQMGEAGATPDEIRQRMRLGTLATAQLYLEYK